MLERTESGSKVVLADATCVAVDTAPAVVKRNAARSCGRNAVERNAIVIDRFLIPKQRHLPGQKRTHIS
jgi:hypothetical protein